MDAFAKGKVRRNYELEKAAYRLPVDERQPVPGWK
jgi:hypothetical protein